MKVLFISSGNSGQASPIVKNQADSIVKFDNTVQIEFFLIKGKGMFGYLKNIPLIRKYVKKIKPDIIHAHYSFCGIIASLSFTKIPIITSLMGSDVRISLFYKKIVRVFIKYIWNKTIVKSDDIKNIIGIKKVITIPNGVNLKKFYPIQKNEARKKLNWALESKIILFASDPSRPEKNWKLAKESIEIFDNEILVKYLKNIPNEEMVYYYNATDVILLCSLWEGSPNVIKEAMACNRPIVATNVGDIKWLFGNEPGHFLADFESKDVAEKLKLAIEYRENNGATKGRERIIELGLDSETIAQKIIEVYNSVLQKKINENIF